MRISELVAMVVIAAGCGGDSTQTHPIPGDRGPAITVEVLNANGRAGDARIGTRRLRQGHDRALCEREQRDRDPEGQHPPST